MTTNGAVDDAGPHKQPGKFGCRRLLIAFVGGYMEMSTSGEERRILCAFEAMLATRRDINATLGDRWLPHEPSGLGVPRSCQEDMWTEHACLGDDSKAREVYGLLDAGCVRV